MSSIHTGPTQIQYVIVSNSESLDTNDFNLQVFDCLRQFPKDLLQLEDSEKFFKVSCLSNYKKSLNIFSFPLNIIREDNDTTAEFFQSYTETFNQDLVKIFLIDSKIQQHERIASILHKIPFSYFFLIGDVIPEVLSLYNKSSRIKDARDFIEKINRQLGEINTLINPVTGYQVGSFKLGSNQETVTLNPRYPTHLADNNFYLLNQILGNWWASEKLDEADGLDEIWQKRVTFQVEQIIAIDNLYANAVDERYATLVEPKFPPLLIAAPFHFPNNDNAAKKQYLSKKERDIIVLSKAEQNLNYTYNIESDRVERLGPQTTGVILSELTKKLIMLDKLSYLHALLSFSPYYRLPVIGSSINSDLSHFLGNFPARKSAVNKINIFGEKLQSLVLDPVFKDILKERNGQLVVVSDLPIEWLKLNNFPLALSHDICRVPEFNINSLLSNMLYNQRVQYRIKDDIIAKTLIIHCAGENDIEMRHQFTVIDSYKSSIGFDVAMCHTVEEIKAAVDKYRPELLIFDCHGNFNKKTSESYLVIDQNKKIYLTGDDIIKNGISAPLVFLSACSTSPNYGFVNQLSDAFFQAGALSVTATYLPIAMRGATMLIFRLLNNLKQHTSKVISINWLAFICHTMRATVIYDAIHIEIRKKTISADYDHRKIAEILVNLMTFETRLDTFEQINSYLKTINPIIEVDFSQLDNEWLSYTVMGRADLIYFENWHESHLKMHLGETELNDN